MGLTRRRAIRSPLTLRSGLVFAVVAPWFAWAVIRAFGLDGSRFLTLLMAFTPYAAITSPLPVILAIAAHRRVSAAVALMAACALVAPTMPRALRAPRPTDFRAASTLTVMSLNMDDGRASASSIASLVDRMDVDVLVLLELKSALPRLAAAGLDKTLPHQFVSKYARAGGTAVVTRMAATPVARTRLFYQPEPPTIRLHPLGTPPVEIAAVHPPHPTTASYEAEWRTRLDAIPQANQGRSLSIVAGDFNATLDQSAFRDVVARGYRDAAAASGDGLQGTWPTSVPLLRLAIDHVLADRRIVVRAVHVEPVAGTDHRALLAQLQLPPQSASSPG